MFLDASAMVAMITREPDHAELTARLEAATTRETSPVALFETALGVSRKLSWTPGEARELVEEFLAMADVTVAPIDGPTWIAAVEAFERFGKGRHSARLNMGDCFAYACARVHGEPLLFKGDDFSRTDITAA